ncbi:cytochrome b [Lacimicrobium alkaliphilum]|uniref:Cytochrome b n=1 Tax=Lacimicrobium alkaliphilum TaxID=1526571 RepID=A0ABQ1REK6_9ALTE|nr:cytochrome b [Lacimicrobium alkaliphilum]GGD67677.1 cytochrome b [Lacimicrobium alkaliphilum]
MKANTDSWGASLIIVHWLSALAVFGLFALGWWMVDLTYYSDWYRTAPHTHKSVGILLALLTLFRLFWRATHKRPAPLGNKVERRTSGLAHKLIYMLLILLFTSGYLISTADGRGIEVFDWFTVPGFGSVIENQEDLAGDIHEWLAYTLIALAVLHALAALKHHLINKDKTLTRMIKF